MYDKIHYKKKKVKGKKKSFACQCRRHRRLRFDLWVRKITQKRKWQPISILQIKRNLPSIALAPVLACFLNRNLGNGPFKVPKGMDEQSVQAKESTEDADCTRWQLWVHIRLTWHRHTVFSHPTRTECGYKVIGFSGTEMSPGPLVPSISVLLCSAGSLASLKIPKDLG